MTRLPLLVLALWLVGCASEAPPEGSPSEEPAAVGKAEDAQRRFEIDYRVQLEPPAGEQTRLWIPLPSDDDYQQISDLKVVAAWPQRAGEDARGNRVLYLEGEGAGRPVEVSVRYTVLRRERRVDLSRRGGFERLSDPAPYLRGSKLLVVDEEIRAVHARVTPAGADTLAKARAYYDHVREHMSYDKSGQGWGRGDSVYACEVGKGNCTDFHSYFQALCLVEGIPTRFAIGLYGAYELRSEPYTTGGYHCWAEFFVEERGWIPVDISEADKHPERAEQFFGGHSANRVTLSRGRDLVLEPAQAGPPLNYFVNPYAEAGGRPLAVSKTVAWTDLAP